MLSSFLRLTPIKKIIGVALFLALTFLIFTLLKFFTQDKNAVKVEELALNTLPSEMAITESKLATINSKHAPQGQISPDLLLIEVYKNLAENKFHTAQTKVEEILKSYPNFQLAHLIHGDLIAMRTKPTVQLGSTYSVNSATDAKLKDLHNEAIARLKAITERPQTDFIPSNLLQMSHDQKYVLVMDAKRARIYLYENKQGIPTLISDYYVSQGKLGMDKFREGDQRTPLGVYFITSRLPGSKLPDLYGPGALPINYPNEWDKRNGRGGSGIWLHGAPSANYSRAPLASDGCIVLSNPDFIYVADTVEKTKTPVIVSDKLHFINRQQWEQEKQSAFKLIDDWRVDVESKNTNQIISHYSTNYKGFASESLSTKIAKQQKLLSELGDIKVAIKDVYQYKYPGQSEMIVSGFTQVLSSSRGLSNFKNQQYWAKENNQWKIVYEEQNFISGANLEPLIVKNDLKTPSTSASNEVNKPSSSSEKPSSSDQKMVASAVDHWAASWSKQNMNAYYAHYAKDFITPSGMNRKAWMDDRRARIEGKKTITVTLSAINIKVNGNTASVKFKQRYQSGVFNANTRKTLLMIKQDGKWLIKQESTG